MQRRTIKQISVEGFLRRKPGNRVVYSINVTWSDKSDNVIYRRYSEVRQLELTILENFPSCRQQISTSSLQDRWKFIPTSVRRKVDKMRDFISKLMALSEHISQSQLVITFFTPRIEDVEWEEPEANHHPKSKLKMGKNSFRKRHSNTADNIGEPVLLEQYVALKDYKKQYHNDISLIREYTMGVIEKHESGWWLVDCEGDIGWVPASFIKPAGGDNDNDDDDVITESFPPGRGEMHMTTQSYQANNADEISFDIGVHLEVIEKTLDGWWRVIYMNKEGLVPAVYLKRLGFAAVSTPMSLRRLSGISMSLRDDASHLDRAENNGSTTGGGSNLLLPVWNGPRRHSASEAELSSLTKEFLESRLSDRRSSLNDIREALPNRGLYISPNDLRLADQQEKERQAATTKVKRSRSFNVVSDHVKEFLGQKSTKRRVFAENATAAMAKEKLRKRSASEVDLHSVDLREEKHSVSKNVQRSHSFSLFSGNIKEVEGQRNVAESVLTEIVKGKADITTFHSCLNTPKIKSLLSSPSAKRRHFRGEGSQETPALRHAEAREQFSLPIICVTPSASVSEHSPMISNICTQGNVESQFPINRCNNEIIQMSDNKGAEKVEKTERDKENKWLLGLEVNYTEEAGDKTDGTNKQQPEEHKQRNEDNRRDIQEEKIEIDVFSGKGERGQQINEADELKREERKSEVMGQDKSKAVDVGEAETAVLEETVLVNKEQQNARTERSFQTNGATYYAVAAYEPSGTGEVTLHEGDEVKVKWKAANGWWMAHVRQETGWAPSNFLVAADEYQEMGNIGRQETDEHQDSDTLLYDHDDDHNNDDDDNDDDDDDFYDDDDDVHDERNSDNYDSNDEDHDEDDEERKPNVYILPAWKQRSHLNAQKGRRQLIGPYQESNPPEWALSNKCSFESIVKDRYVVRSSSGTESSSSNRRTRYKINRRENREGKAFIDNPQRYKRERVNHTRSFESSSSCREADMRSPKEKGYSPTKETLKKKKSPLLKQTRVRSYDSGYPEDEKRKLPRKTKQFVSQPSRRRSNGDGAAEYFSKSDSSTNHTGQSSDDEVFPVRRTKYFSCYDSDVASYNLRERREIRRERNRLYNQLTATSNSPGRPTRRRRRKRIYHAIAMYQATSDDTVDLYEGDEVQVIRKRSGGWWYVRIDDEEGWAPSNFLEPTTWHDD